MTDTHYAALLARTDLANVYHMPLDGEAGLVVAAEQNGCAVFRIDLAAAHDKAGMLDVIGRTLEFPEGFGHNWDALLDGLADFSWRPAEGYVVILEHCDGIHGRAEADFVQLLQVFETAANEWREQGVAFWCFVDMMADGINWLSDIG
jgi:RNAse (barnase) inhibitor barstar